MQMIQLLPGLEISVADDGTWLHFDGGGIKSTIRLESIAPDHDLVIGRGITQWCERFRNSAIVERPTKARKD